MDREWDDGGKTSLLEVVCDTDYAGNQQTRRCHQCSSTSTATSWRAMFVARIAWPSVQERVSIFNLCELGARFLPGPVAVSL